MANMKPKKYKWLLWANLLTLLPSLVFAILAGLVFKDAAGYIGIVFIPLFIATDIVLIIDVIIGIKILYRKWAKKV